MRGLTTGRQSYTDLGKQLRRGDHLDRYYCPNEFAKEPPLVGEEKTRDTFEQFGTVFRTGDCEQHGAAPGSVGAGLTNSLEHLPPRSGIWRAFESGSGCKLYSPRED